MPVFERKRGAARRRRSYSALVDVVEKRSAILSFSPAPLSAKRKRISGSACENGKAVGRSRDSVSGEKFQLVKLQRLSLIQSGPRA